MVTLLGYGTTTKSLCSFLNAQGIQTRIYDDLFTYKQTDSFGNELLPTTDSHIQEFYPMQSQSTPYKLFEEVSKLDSIKNLKNICITSPGIPPHHKLIIQAQKLGVLLSEYDFFYALLENQGLKPPLQPEIAWISGTNGKTTTTQLTQRLLAHLDAQSGGNIGTPLCTLFENRTKIWILETSSFSLHYTYTATPKVYALLPVSQDHIAWHGNYENYLNDKLSVLERMKNGSFAILPQEFIEHKSVQAFKGNAIYYRNSKDLATQLHINLETIKLREPFLLDGLIALATSKFLCHKDSIEGDTRSGIKILNSFEIGTHRLEEFRDSHKNLWVDDSKGTNINATIQALLRYKDYRILLILGGDDKGADFTPLFECLQQLTQNTEIIVFAIGKSTSKILSFAKLYNLQAYECTYLQDAVLMIKTLRQKGDVALLSPACASLDQFTSYKQRGDLFQKYALDTNTQPKAL